MLFDRYLVLSADDACDLATGAVVRIASLADQPVHRPAAVASLADVLDHGCDGAPRALTVTIPIGSGWNAAADRVAGDAVARGYIPIAVSLYTRVSALIGDELRETVRCSCWRRRVMRPPARAPFSMPPPGHRGRTCC